MLAQGSDNGIEIERDAHTQQFVVVHNRVARDKTLSRAARGLLLELLSLPPGHRTNSVALQDGGPEGRDAIRKMLRELEAAGYIRRFRDHAPEGRWRYHLRVYETPQIRDVSAGETSDGFPGAGLTCDDGVSAGETSDGFPGPGFPGPGFPGGKELKDEELKDEDQTLSARAREALAEALPKATDEEREIILTNITKRLTTPSSLLSYLQAVIAKGDLQKFGPAGNRSRAPRVYQNPEDQSLYDLPLGAT